jgi:diguanylate cyclase
VVLLAEIAQRVDALFVADKMIALLNVPHPIGEHVLGLSASIGISVYPEDGDDAPTLIERADAAMYRAKRRGAGSSVFYGDALDNGPRGDLPARAARPVPAPPAVSAARKAAARSAHLQEANERLVLVALDAQELQDAMLETKRRQTEFLTSIANELRNPQAPIRLAAAQLGLEPSHEALLPRAQAIIEYQAAHMARLVNDLLEMSYGSAGRLRFRREPVDLVGVIETVVASIKPALAARRQRIVVLLSLEPLVVAGNAGHLSQVVTNLLDNASKYTPDGGEINISASKVGPSILVTVQDNGLGITPEALPHIFDPFAQDTHAIGFNGVGVGIGLTVVRELVEAHGGTVLASSAGRGYGSQFVVTLPGAEAPRSTAAPTA